MPESGSNEGNAGGAAGAPAVQHRTAIVAAVIAAVGTVVGAALTGLITVAGENDTAPKPTPVGSSTAAPDTGHTAASAEDGPPQDGAAPENGRKCRANWQLVPQAGVEIRPCIERRGTGFTVSVDTRAGTSEALGEVTVWVWLMDVDKKLTDDRLDLTRRASEVEACRIPLKESGSDSEGQTCSANVEPWTSSLYTASAHAEIDGGRLPQGWESRTGFAGVQAVHVLRGTP